MQYVLGQKLPKLSGAVRDPPLIVIMPVQDKTMDYQGPLPRQADIMPSPFHVSLGHTPGSCAVQRTVRTGTVELLYATIFIIIYALAVDMHFFIPPKKQ